MFSYNQSSIDSVYKYIQNQEEHHKKQTFRDEYLALLMACKVEYDEKYLFKIWYKYVSCLRHLCVYSGL